MPHSDMGRWYPDLFAQQVDVYNCTKRATLVCGPRLTGKTIAVLHKIVRHMWETPRARVAMFSRTIKNSADGGPWMKLHRDIVPEWVKGMGLKYTTFTADGKPGFKVNGQTRTQFFRIRNFFGGESECMLFSMDDDNAVEAKIKEMEFSMIYFSELSKFGTRQVLSMALPSLRMLHLKFEQHQWIADTNPAEEGEASWIYRVWYQERVWTYEQYCTNNKKEGLPVLDEPTFLSFQEQLGLYEWGLDDNPRIDPRQIEEVKVACGYDIGQYERFVKGKWVFGMGDASRHFRGYFRYNLHVVGNCESPNDEDWEIALPSDGCFELVTGWDPGDTNHAAVIMEVRIINGRAHFTVLDEVVSIGKECSTEEFTDEVMRIVHDLEETAGHDLNLDKAYADTSVMKYQATGDTYPAMEIEAASNGRISVIPVKKPQGSVGVRVRVLKQLLAQGRIKVSAHCAYTIRMFRDLKKGLTKLSFVHPDENKHVFDALSYAILEECFEELEMLQDIKTGRMSQRSSKSLIVQV